MKKNVLLFSVIIAGLLFFNTVQAQQKVKANPSAFEEAEIEQLVQEYLERGIPEETARPRVEAIVKAKNGVSLRSRLATPPTKSIHVARNPAINAYTPEQLVKKVLLGDSRAESAISGVSFTGTWSTTATSRSLVHFENGAALGIEKGLLLATGAAGDAEGPNPYGGTLGGGSAYLTGDVHLGPIASPYTIQTGSILQFDFKPYSSKISFDFIFASEEFPEYSNSTFNDVFGFFIWALDGTGDTTNIALFPDGTTPVTINNSNWGQTNTSNNTPTYLPAPKPDAVHPEWHVPNYQDTYAGSDSIMEYGGRTILLTAVADNLDTEKTYRLKLAIANVYDTGWGSAVFLSNLDLGFPDAGIEPGQSLESDQYKWDEKYDLIAPNQWYAGCPQALELKFVANAAERDVRLTYLGLADKYLVGADGKAMPSQLKLAAGDTVVRLNFMTTPVPSELEGGTGAILAAIDMGGSDTTDYFNFYNRPTYSVDFRLPTAQYAGKLELNLKGGSPNMLRSINGGITWQNAWLPFTGTDIYNIGLNGVIILREPHSCCDAVIPFGKTEEIMPVVRAVKIPTIAGVDISPTPGQHFVNSRSNLTVTIRPTGDKAGMIPVLSTNRTLIPDSVGVVLKEVRNGVYTFVIYNVQQELDIRIDFIPDPSGIASVDETAVWGDRGSIGITSARAGEVKIYNISGVQVQTFVLPAATASRISLPPGVYIVSLNGKTYKAIVK